MLTSRVSRAQESLLHTHALLDQAELLTEVVTCQVLVPNTSSASRDDVPDNNTPFHVASSFVDPDLDRLQ